MDNILYDVKQTLKHFLAASLSEKQHYFFDWPLVAWAFYARILTFGFSHIIFVGNDFDKKQYAGSTALVAELCLRCACSARPLLTCT